MVTQKSAQCKNMSLKQIGRTLLQKKNHIRFSTYEKIYAKIKKRDLHYTSLPRDELPLNPRYNSIWRCRFHTLFFLSLFSSPFDGSTCASLMDLTRGTIFDASGCIVSFMTLITLCMRELRYIMYLITPREVHYTKQ